MLALKSAVNSRSRIGLGSSYRDMPSAMRELSWGQTDPLWYDIGL
jgi:hypothetical protein